MNVEEKRAYRDKILEAFANEFGELSSANRKELIRLMGDPPDVRNVPLEFWERVKQQEGMSIAKWSLLSFLLAGLGAGIATYLISLLTDGLLAKNVNRKLNELWEKAQEGPLDDPFDQRAMEHALRQAGESVEQRFQTSEQRLGRAQSRYESKMEKGLEVKPDEVAEDVGNVFGPVRDAQTVVTEGAKAGGAGSDAAKSERQKHGEVPGVDFVRVWVMDPSCVHCTFCPTMDGTTEDYWGRYVSIWPPHPNCLLPRSYILPISPVMAVMCAYYRGYVQEMFFDSSTRPVRVTPNHLFLHREGWMEAKHVRSGTRLMRMKNSVVRGLEMHEIGELVSKFIRISDCNAFRVKPHESFFHGDGGNMAGQIEIACRDRMFARHSARYPLSLRQQAMARTLFALAGPARKSSVSVSSQASDLDRIDHGSYFIRQFQPDLTSCVVHENVARWYEGPVFDLHTEPHNAYALHTGVLAHNCCCEIMTVPVDSGLIKDKRPNEIVVRATANESGVPLRK